MDLCYSTINIYNGLKLKYSDYLKPQILSIIMIGTEDAVYLKIVEIEILNDGLEKQTTDRINLDFIVDEEPDELFFNPKDPIEINARKFIHEFSPYSIINTISLFHDEACEKINKNYHVFGIDR